MLEWNGIEGESSNDILLIANPKNSLSPYITTEISMKLFEKTGKS
jgi:hypothetical protein